MSSAHPSKPSAETGSASDDVVTIPVVQEQIDISTVTEHTGTVRVRKVIRHDSGSVPLSAYRERVEIERKPINRPVEGAQPSRQEADVLIIPVYEERFVKQLFLAEEIHVKRNRETVQGDEAVTLRREEIIVERFDPRTQQWVLDPG